MVRKPHVLGLVLAMAVGALAVTVESPARAQSKSGQDGTDRAEPASTLAVKTGPEIPVTPTDASAAARPGGQRVMLAPVGDRLIALPLRGDTGAGLGFLPAGGLTVPGPGPAPGAAPTAPTAVTGVPAGSPSGLLAASISPVGVCWNVAVPFE